MQYDNFGILYGGDPEAKIKDTVDSEHTFVVSKEVNNTTTI